MTKNISLLGSTGSIGTQSLDVARLQGYNIKCLSANSRVDIIENQIRENPQITTEELAQMSKKGLRTIKRHIAKMPHIRYVGSGYSGHWEVLDKE